MSFSQIVCINIHWLALIGLLARLSVAFATDRIHHPDEVFQYLEQAHRLVFGYGYIPWEYRFGTRSWIVPGFISIILFFCKFLGIDDPATYVFIVKVVFCVISTSLIYFVYIIGREIAGEMAGKLAAVFTCFWYELIYFAHKPNPEVLSTYLVAASWACVVSKSGKRHSLLFGFSCALAIALRIQYLPAIAILALYASVRLSKYNILVATVTFFLTMAIAGYIDYFTWGSFFVSYYNNYLFLSIHGVNKLFGEQHFTYFLRSLTIASAGAFAITGLISLLKLDKTWLLIIIVSAIILSHSLIPHKEHRFIFVTVPIFLVLLAIVISDEKLIATINLPYISTVMLFFISLTGLLSNLPLQENIISNASDPPLLTKQEILQAYLFLNKEPALFAILNASASWPETGGYYYLHRDVPIYFQENLKWNDNLPSYVSHIICATNQEEVLGFTTVLRMRTLEVRRQINPPAHYVILDLDTKNVLHKGIDDKYTPTIRKRGF